MKTSAATDSPALSGFRSLSPKSVAELPTPALVIDAAIVRRNSERLARYAAQHRLAVRPHTKTHKSRVLAALQLAAGAIGLTVAKVGEAEQMKYNDGDLLMAYPAVDAFRCERLAKLANETTIRVAVDSITAVEALAGAARASNRTIGLLVDVSLCGRRPKVGARVTVIPNHICPCVNLQDVMWWLEPGGDVNPLAVDARGKLS